MSSSSLGEGNPITTLVSGVGNTAANHAGTWNQTSQYQDIVGVTTTIAGTANTTLLFGALDDAVVSINQKGIIRSLDYKTSVVAGNWNSWSGAFSPALSTTIAGGWSIMAELWSETKLTELLILLKKSPEDLLTWQALQLLRLETMLVEHFGNSFGVLLRERSLFLIL